MALLDTLRQRAEDEQLPLRVILKEALQVYTLAAIYGQPASDHITFQGGTCLRLVYGGPRYSEDVDFVTTLDDAELAGLFEQVRREVTRLAPLFAGEVTLRVQKATQEMARWKVHYRAARQQDSTSISLEFAPYPAYTDHVAVLTPPADLPALPLVVVRAEALEEIMADKITAIAGRRYVKGRDVFDLWWLKRKGIQVNRELVEKKLSDYEVQPERLHENLAAIEPVSVRRELGNFLPHRYRVQLLQQAALEAMVAEVKVLLEGIAP
ncbi:MAG: nucleotidyl transferase AbiEii/AbiGii toxin family protein [Anaerolineae bacterium]